MEFKPPTIVSSTTSKGIDRKKANRMVDPKGYFHPKMPMSEDVHNLAPDICSIIKVEGHTNTYRVTGWLCEAPPPKPEPGLDGDFNDWIDHSLDASHEKRLMWCKREDAQYVSGSGVSGVIAPLNKIKVVGRVNWSNNDIEDQKRTQARRIGTLVF